MSIKNLPESSLSGLTPQTSSVAVISSSTGSPTITTDGTATVYKFTGDGTLVVGTAGAVRVMCLGGGGSAWDTGGGAGGMNILTLTLPVGTYAVKIGAGGAGGGRNNGGISSIGLSGVGLSADGGGGGTIAWQAGSAGGCGGGAAGGGIGAALPTWQGFAGGNVAPGTYSGGGGQGGVGGNNNGGPGIQSTFTGVSINIAAGGRGNAAANGTYWTGVANSGDGGQALSGNGWSGVVIVRVG